MKTIFTSFLVLLLTSYSFSQAPEKFSYQAVIRNATGNLLTNSNIGLEFKIHQGSPTGTIVYSETTTGTTNDNGLVTYEIGSSAPITANWESGPNYLEVNIDPNGGTSYTISSTTELISVPYALHANTAENVMNDAVDDADSDPANEIQTISLSGNDLSISNGNTITLPAGSGVQTLSQSGSTVTLSDGGGSISVEDNDADPSNEIQSLSQSGSTVTLSNGGGSISIDDNDNDPTNEYQSLSISGQDLTLSNGNTVTIPGGSSNTLDQAYDEGGAGAGRTIAADNGAVEINASTAASVGLDVNHSNTGVAIRARSTNTSNGFSTAQFESNSSQGTSLSPIGGAVGVYTGTAAFGTGLAGQNLVTTPNIDAHGVYGLASNNSSGGVYGRNALAFGVVGTGLYGLFGEAENLNGGGVVGQLSGLLGATQAGYLGAYRNTFEYAVYADNDILFEGFLDGASGGAYTISGDATTGNFTVLGNLSKGGGTFKIDHPQDPENKYLYHSFVESPDMMNIYNGIAEFDSNGIVTVSLPDYFESLNKEFRYQLTPVGAAMPNLYVAEEIIENSFQIAGGEPGKKVSWQVTGVRHDNYANANRVVPEVEKESYNKGRYLHPTLFGQPKSQGVHLRDPNAKGTMQEGHLNKINSTKPATLKTKN